MPRRDVTHLAEWPKGQHQIVGDGSFIDFADAEASLSLLGHEVLRRYPRLVVVKSISKSFGVPGLGLAS